MISPCAQTQYNNRSLFVVSESALTHPETYSSWSITASFCSSSCNCSEQWHLSEQSINSLPLEFNPFKKASKLKAFPAWCANTRGFVIYERRPVRCPCPPLPLFHNNYCSFNPLKHTLNYPPKKPACCCTPPPPSPQSHSLLPLHNTMLIYRRSFMFFGNIFQ